MPEVDIRIEKGVVAGPTTTTTRKSDDSSVREEYYSIPEGRARAIVGLICVMQIMQNLDSTSIAISLPSIAKALNAPETAIFAISTVHLLLSVVFQPVFAEVSHVVGRRPVYLAGLAMVALGALVAALGRNVWVVLAGRAVMGTGAAGPLTLNGIILADIFPLRRRAKWMAVMNAVGLLGFTTGPVIGAGLLKVSWTWLFWINLLVIALAAPFAYLLFGFDTAGKREEARRLAAIDWAGILLFLPSGALCLAGITLGGVIFPWGSPAVITPLAAGTTGLAALALHQRCVAARPMFRPGLFASRASVAGFLASGVLGMCLWMAFYYLCLFWQGVRGLTPLQAGVALLPDTLSVGVGAAATGFLISRTGRVRWAQVLGWGFGTAGLFLLWFSDEATPTPVLVFVNLVAGLGCGIGWPAASMTVLATNPDADRSHATAMLNVLRGAGTCLGVAVATAIFSNRMHGALREGGRLSDSGVTAQSLLRLLGQLKGDDPLDGSIRAAMVGALRAVWVTAGSAAAVAATMMWTAPCPRIPKDKELEEQNDVISRQ